MTRTLSNKTKEEFVQQNTPTSRNSPYYLDDFIKLIGGDQWRVYELDRPTKLKVRGLISFAFELVGLHCIPDWSYQRFGSYDKYGNPIELLHQKLEYSPAQESFFCRRNVVTIDALTIMGRVQKRRTDFEVYRPNQDVPYRTATTEKSHRIGTMSETISKIWRNT